MDRTMYGKFVPGTLHPYQCTLRNGTSPGCRKIEDKLKTFNKIPIFIVENHNDVLQFIYRQIGAKYLPFKGSTILHFDSHPDLLIPINMQAHIVYDKLELFEQIDIENWLMPAAYAGHITQIVWLKPPWAQQINDGLHEFIIGQDQQTGKIRLNCKETYFVSESLFKPKSKLTNQRNIVLDVFTIGKSLNQNNDIEDTFEETKQLLKKYETTSIILDIDLDFFSTENPFLRMFNKASVYEKLKEIYRYTPPLSKSDEHVEKTSENRREQIDKLFDIFNYLDCNQNLPKLDIENNEIHRKIHELYICIMENYDMEDFDWNLLHLAGCTFDETELPHHRSTSVELDVMFKSFKQFLNCLTKPPIIITISRSSLDDYTPSDDVEFIQEKVLEMLKDKFQCNEPVLYYDITNVHRVV